MFNRGFIVVCIFAFVTALGLGIIVPILPLYAKDLGASGLMLGLIFSSLFVSMAIFNPFMGRLSDRIGKKVLISSGFGIGIFVAISYALASGPVSLIVIRLVHGVTAAMVIPITMAYIGDLSPEGKEGTYMGVYGMTLLLGGATGPIAGGKIADHAGMNLTFYAFAVTMGICFFLTLLFLPEQKGKKVHPISKSPVKDILASKPLKGLFVFGFTLAVANSGLMMAMPLLAQHLQLTNTEIGILASSFTLFSGIFQVPFGMLANRYNKVSLVLFGTLALAIGLAYLPFSSEFLILACFSSLLGIFSAISSPAANAMVVEHSREIGLGTVTGAMSTFSSLGMILGPIAAGIVMDQINLTSAFHLYAMIFIVGAGVFYYYTKDL